MTVLIRSHTQRRICNCIQSLSGFPSVQA
jgi:hypothetical protein